MTDLSPNGLVDQGPPAEIQITNLLYRYAELIDTGDFAATAELFRHAQVVLDPDSGYSVGEDGIRDLWASLIKLNKNGLPGVKHLVTNPIVEVDRAAGTATARSYYTVLQRIDEEVTVIASGRYHDKFGHIDGEWCFTERDYSLLDLPGDMSHHLRS